jgi:hypothetical protein
MAGFPFASFAEIKVTPEILISDPARITKNENSLKDKRGNILEKEILYYWKHASNHLSFLVDTFAACVFWFTLHINDELTLVSNSIQHNSCVMKFFFPYSLANAGVFSAFFAPPFRLGLWILWIEQLPNVLPSFGPPFPFLFRFSIRDRLHRLYHPGVLLYVAHTLFSHLLRVLKLQAEALSSIVISFQSRQG